jgi:predicted O-methyltransferase YrrM
MTQDQWTAVDEYITGLLMPEDAVLNEVLKACAVSGLPEIQVSASQGKLLMLLAQMQGARRILEIGTLGGYSAIWLARALPPGGRLITLEADPKHAEVARANFALAGVSGKIDLRLGNALDTLPLLAAEVPEPFDLIFLDADKQGYTEYFAWALKLSRPGTVIVADNVVRDGEVIDAESEDASVQGIQRFNKALAAESRVSATMIQTVGSKGYDGFALAIVSGR